jgi:hypothetical protein
MTVDALTIYRVLQFVDRNFRAPPGAAYAAPEPGFPLQFLGFAYANPAGFPLQSLARRIAANTGRQTGNLPRNRRLARSKNGKGEEALARAKKQKKEKKKIWIFNYFRIRFVLSCGKNSDFFMKNRRAGSGV